jgi:hypothetical protein
MFWVRVGEERDYVVFQDLANVIVYLNRLKVGVAAYWRMGRETGFETAKYQGDNYIALYRGGREGNIISALLPDERISVEEGLLGQYV